MKKSLKLVATAMMVCTSLATIAPQAVNAQAPSGQLMLVRDWIQRSRQEVETSIQEDLQISNTYTIRWGDTLGTIAKAMQISVAELMAINNIENPNHIVAGHSLSLNLVNPQVEVPEITSELEEVEPVEDTLVEETVEDIFVAESEIVMEETTVWEEIPVETSIYHEPTVVYEETTYSEPLFAASSVYETETTEEVTYAEPLVEETSDYLVETTEEITYEEVTEAETTSAPVYDYSGDAYAAFAAITQEKGLSQSEIDGWSMIINRESGWNTTIANPSSGAYGLPQALPGSKMASHGADWATNPYTQLAWMYDYMVGRYGSIQGAVDFWNANHWY